MISKRAWAPYLGIVAALCVPAFVAAQNFGAGNVLRASDLQALSDRIAALENNLGVGPVQSITAFGPNETGTKTFRASGDGIMVARSIGGGFTTAQVNVNLPSGTVGRVDGRACATVPLNANDVVTLTSSVSIAGTITLFWFPLNGNSSLQ